MGNRIVHVEDDEIVRKLIAMALRGPDTEIISVGDPLEAAHTIATAVPDLIICDISMPGKNGFEVIREIRNATPPVEAPVIFFSAMGDDVYVRMAMDLGAVDFVRKPASATEIRARVKAWLGDGAASRRQKSTVMRGQMDVLNVADMLRFLDIRQRSGIIKIWQDGQRVGEIHVSQSHVVAALDNDGSGEEAARRLVAMKTGDIEAVILDQVEGRPGVSIPLGKLIGESLPPVGN